jgi:hypothetical protein
MRIKPLPSRACATAVAVSINQQLSFSYVCFRGETYLFLSECLDGVHIHISHGGRVEALWQRVSKEDVHPSEPESIHRQGCSTGPLLTPKAIIWVRHSWMDLVLREKNGDLTVYADGSLFEVS